MKTFKCAFITGASSGLGQSTTYKLYPYCEKMILLGQDNHRLEETRRILQEKYRYSGEVQLLSLDLSSLDFLNQIQQLKYPIDLVINNAGVGFADRFEHLSQKQIDQMILINIRSLTLLCRHFAHLMLAEKGGTIVNVSSAASFLPIPYFSVYAATKSYVLSFTIALNHELATKGVQVKAYCPGGLDTRFHNRSGLNDKIIERNKSFVKDPDDAANDILKLINGKSSWRTSGVGENILYFLSRIFSPDFLAHLAGKMYLKFIPTPPKDI